MVTSSFPEVNVRLMTGFALILCLAGAVFGAVGWRTDGRGNYPEAEPPTRFSETEGVVWAAPMPAWSNASPVVLPDRIFVCAEPDLLIAVNKEDGKILWQKASPIGEALISEEAARLPPAKTHAHTGFTSATPVTDGERVFATFGSGVLAAYSIDGERLWTRFVERPENRWGHSASPVLSGGLLIVHYETLIAFDPETGDEVWRQDKEKWTDQRKKCWGTCVPTKIGDVDVLVTVSGRVIRAKDGSILFESLGETQYATPLIENGVVYFMNHRKGVAVRLPESVDGQPQKLWETQTSADRYYGSPALLNGFIYVITRGGEFSAFDAADGTEVFRQKLELNATAPRREQKNAAYTSPTVAGGLIFFAGMDGSVVAVKPGVKYEELARNKVEKELRSNPVFEGQRMYLRAPGKLYCFGK
jgi:outer membrane protein assembly factor BamB